MNDDKPSLAPRRVVVFSRDESLALMTLGGRAQVVLVGSPYQAAAEVVSGGAMAIVVDLRCLSRRHIRLIEVARTAGCPIIGVGDLPAGVSSADLSGVKLLGVADLDKEFAALSEGRQPSSPPAEAKPKSSPLAEKIADVLDPDAVAGGPRPVDLTYISHKKTGPVPPVTSGQRQTISTSPDDNESEPADVDYRSQSPTDPLPYRQQRRTPVSPDSAPVRQRQGEPTDQLEPDGVANDPRELDHLLTPEELAALLENDL